MSATAPPPPAASPATPRPAGERRRSTTRRWLRRLRAWLLAVAAVLLVTSVWAYQGVHGTIGAVSTRTVPAILELADARAALAEADRAAMGSFADSGSQLASFRPGERYQNQIVRASQSLAQAAEDNATGEDGSRRLQLVEGLLVSYTGYIGQAGANYQQEDTVLGTADLWNASRLLHRDPDGILPQLGELIEEHQATLDEQLSSGWTAPVAVLTWVVPAVALLALLLVAQGFLRRRFRRALNPWLLAATVLLVGLVPATWLAQGALDRLDDARRMLDEVTTSREAAASAAGATAQDTLRQLVQDECAECEHTLATLTARAESEAGDEAPAGTSHAAAQAAAREVNERTVAAGARDEFVGVVLGLAVGVAVLVTAGFHRPIEDYKYTGR